MIYILANDFNISNKITYTYLYYSQIFATPYALKCYISEKYQYIDKSEPSYSNIQYDESDLWVIIYQLIKLIFRIKIYQLRW